MEAVELNDIYIDPIWIVLCTNICELSLFSPVEGSIINVRCGVRVKSDQQEQELNSLTNF
jgi:hypothetical protein